MDSLQIEKHLLSKGAEFVGQGRHRRSFRRKNVVYKVPRSYSGELANVREHETYKKYGRNPIQQGGRGGTPLARCHMLKNNVLAMEYLTPPTWNRRGKDVPGWAHNWDWNCDGAQIGFDRKGNLRIFDYAE